MPRPIDYPTARRLAVEAQVDPRTILRLARGGNVRGMAGERARAALAELGLPSSPPSPASPPVPTTKP